MRPCSAISCRCWSRCVGAVSAVLLGTAPERGGTITRASGWRSATERETPSWSYTPSPVNEATGPVIWSSKGPTCEPSSTSLVVSSDATIRPVSASTPMWSLRQDRRTLVPCFLISHSPGPTPLGTVFLGQPLARTAELQPRAVHQQVYRRAPRLWPRHLQRLGPAAEGAVVRHREIEAKQLQDGADQPLGLAQRQAEHRPQCQRRGDRQIGVAGLTAPTGAWLSLPGLHRLGRKPHGQATPGTQARIVRCPVGDLVSLLRNVMPAVAVGFERHGRRPSTIEGSPPHQPTRGRPPRRPVQQRR